MTEAITKIERLIERGSLVQAQAKLKNLGSHEDALRLQAKVLLAQGQAGAAQQLLLAALKQHPRNHQVYRDLGSLYARAGHLQEAVKVFEQAVHTFPDEPIGYRGIGECLVISKEFRRAAEFLIHAWDKDRSDYKLAAEISKLLLHVGDYGRAEPLVDVACDAEPTNPDFAFLKAEVCFFRDRPEQAMTLYEKAAGSSGRRIAARVRQVGCLTTLGRVDQALQLVDEILRHETGAPRAELLSAKAQLLMTQGDKQGAHDLAREALALKEDVAAAWLLLVQLDAAALSDEDIEAMEKQLPAVDVESRITLGFALAGVHEARGDLARQLECLDQASALKAGVLTYDVDSQRLYMDRLCGSIQGQATNVDQLASLAPASCGVQPLFVVGMPRSGTTLMEQVLSAHPEVAAGGESHAFKYATDRALETFGLQLQEQLWQHPLRDYIPLLAKDYQAFHSAAGVVGSRVTDKAINLYRYLGLLKAGMPGSRIIVMHRHPLDLALGQYKQLFATGQQFTYKVEWIADALAGFYRMLAFWERWGVEMLHVSYEGLVHNQEAVTRRVLAFAGLPWDDACLHFQKNSGAVVTASAVQVREGLFTRAAGRWQRYGELLDPFRKAMGEAGIDISSYETEGPEALVRAETDRGASSVTRM